MQPADREVNDDPVEDHHDSADQGEPGGPEGFVFDLHSHMDEQHEDDKGVKGKGFFRIPPPWAAP